MKESEEVETNKSSQQLVVQSSNPPLIQFENLILYAALTMEQAQLLKKIINGFTTTKSPVDEKTKNLTLNRCFSLHQRIKILCEYRSISAALKIKTYLDYLILLKELSFVDTKILTIFNSTLELVSDCLDHSYIQLENELLSVLYPKNQNGLEGRYLQIHKNLRMSQQIECYEEYLPKSYTHIKTDLIAIVDGYINSLHNKLINIDFDLREHRAIEEIKTLLNQFNLLKMIVDFFPAIAAKEKEFKLVLEEPFNSTIKLYKSKIENVSNSKYSLKDLSLADLHMFWGFFQDCRKLYLLRPQANKLLANLRTQLQKLGKSITSQVESCYENLCLNDDVPQTHVKSMSNHLQHVARNQQRYSEILTICLDPVPPDDFIELWRDNLKYLALNYSATLRMLLSVHHYTKFLALLNRVKDMSSLDSLLGDNTYQKLFFTFNDLYYKELDSHCTKIMDLIEKYRFKMAISEISSLTKLDDEFARQKSILLSQKSTNSILKLLNNVKVKLPMLDQIFRFKNRSQFAELIEEIDQLKNAKQVLHGNNKTQDLIRQSLRKFEIQVVKTLNDFLETLNKYIDNFQLYHALTHFKHMQVILDQLKPYINLVNAQPAKQESSPQKIAAFFSQQKKKLFTKALPTTLPDKIDYIKKKFKLLGQRILNYYASTSIEEYYNIPHSPKWIFDQFKLVNEAGYDDFDMVKQNLQTNIVKKLLDYYERGLKSKTSNQRKNTILRGLYPVLPQEVIEKVRHIMSSDKSNQTMLIRRNSCTNFWRNPKYYQLKYIIPALLFIGYIGIGQIMSYRNKLQP